MSAKGDTKSYNKRGLGMAVANPADITCRFRDGSV